MLSLIVDQSNGVFRGLGMRLARGFVARAVADIIKKGYAAWEAHGNIYTDD